MGEGNYWGKIWINRIILTESNQVTELNPSVLSKNGPISTAEGETHTTMESRVLEQIESERVIKAVRVCCKKSKLNFGRIDGKASLTLTYHAVK